MIIKVLGSLLHSWRRHVQTVDSRCFYAFVGNAVSNTDGKKSFSSMTKECRQARKKIGAARKSYLEKNRTQPDKDYFDQLDKGLPDDETKKFKYPFENLVLAGAGMKGISYVGLIKVLEEHGISEQIKRYAGTSAGSIVAASLAVGFNSYDIQAILKVDFKKLLCDAWWMSYMTNSIYGYGLNPGNKFYKLLGDLLTLKTGDPDITFDEVYKAYDKELCIVTVNVDTNEEMYCHVKTTPGMPIRLAVCMSMSIPWFFTPVTTSLNDTTNHFVDGGLYLNYPVHCYDGWYLSMDRADKFHKKIQEEIMDKKNRFKIKPHQKTTIGAVVFSQHEFQLNSERLEETSVYTSPEMVPYTKLTRTPSNAIEDEMKLFIAGRAFLKILLVEKCKAYKMDDELTRDEFADIFRKEDDVNIKDELGLVFDYSSGDEKYRQVDYVITKDEFADAFNNKWFKEKNQKVLFGEGCDADTAFTAVDENGDGTITYGNFGTFAASTRSEWCEHFNDFKRLDTMISELKSYTGKLNFHKNDTDRTIEISSWYINATDFDLEEDDKKFLIMEGEGSTRKFLKNYVDGNSLEQLSDSETSIRNGKVPKGMSISDKDVTQIIGRRCYARCRRRFSNFMYQKFGLKLEK